MKGEGRLREFLFKIQAMKIQISGGSGEASPKIRVEVDEVLVK